MSRCARIHGRPCAVWRAVLVVLALTLTLTPWGGVQSLLAQTPADSAETPIPIAIPAFSSDDTEPDKWANRLTRVVTADLSRSHAFRPLKQTALAQERVGLNVKPLFSQWRATRANAVLVGHVSMSQSGRLRLALRLWDVASAKQLIGAQYYAPKNNWRRLAHVAADAIHARLTGTPGYFDTRIAFIEQRNDVDPPLSRLAVMDQDGRNLEYLTEGAQPVLYPRFSPAAQQLLYILDRRRSPRIVLRDLQRGVSEVVGDFPGLIAAPRFAPGGHSIVMSLKRGGNANLYEMDLRRRKITRLTETAAIDTQPSVSASGKHIVFVSGRSGTRQLYVMRRDGTAQRRISRGEGSYGEPVWSPRGDVIAFVKRLRGQAFLGLMKPDGSAERLLTSGPDINGLSWAPNGRALVFSRLRRGDQAGGQLFFISVTGDAEQPLETPNSAIDPTWSATMGPWGPDRMR